MGTGEGTGGAIGISFACSWCHYCSTACRLVSVACPRLETRQTTRRTKEHIFPPGQPTSSERVEFVCVKEDLDLDADFSLLTD